MPTAPSPTSATGRLWRTPPLESPARFEHLGHDVIAVGDRAVDPGDAAILEEAYREQRVLVTLDKDFGELAVRSGRPHVGIVRLERVAATEQAAVCLQVLDLFGAELLAGAIITARPDRVRIRRSAQES